MRTLYFLVPGTSGKFRCGGLFAELNTLKLAQQVCPAQLVTYRQRETDAVFLGDLLPQVSVQEAIFVLSWGFDVPRLVQRLRGYHLLYHAHSAGYGFTLPAQIPILAVSRNTMGYWGQQAPHALIYYLPNLIDEAFCDLGMVREIDVLVQARKSSRYLLQQLVPALGSHCQVKVLDAFVPDLAQLFNRAKVYLYDSAEYWAQEGVTEGFGLQPMEAMACGCQVFSSINGGLSDYLDPGVNCQKIAGYSLAFDCQRLLAAIANPHSSPAAAACLAEHRAAAITERLQTILSDINTFFDHLEQSPTPIPAITWRSLWQRRAQKLLRKVQAKLNRQ